MNTKLRYISALFAVTLSLVWCIPFVQEVDKDLVSGALIWLRRMRTR
jgi:hypothetical protein